MGSNAWEDSAMPASRVIVQLDEVTNSCFVAMPFHALYKAEYERVIKPAIQDAGLTCKRGDEIHAHQSIVEDVWHFIRKARLVVAELSERNPNVMYEVGLAHAIGKPIIFLTRNKEDVPFDLGSLRYIYYDTNDPFWGANLRASLAPLVRQASESPTFGTHLRGIQVETTLPTPPTEPVTSKEDVFAGPDLSGVWSTTWLSVSLGIEHKANLVIPAKHGRSFTASLVVTYERSGQRTVVQETMTGMFRDASLSLAGVNYTYLERGASRFYSLDNFELTLAADGKTLVGKATLQNGTRDVSFVRIQELAA
jgi:hypothetical protein